MSAKYQRDNTVISIFGIKKGTIRQETIPAVSNAINENHLFTAYKNRFRTLTSITYRAYKTVKKQTRMMTYFKAKPSDIYDLVYA